MVPIPVPYALSFPDIHNTLSRTQGRRHGGVGFAGHDLGQDVHLLLHLETEHPWHVPARQDTFWFGKIAQVITVISIGKHIGIYGGQVNSVVSWSQLILTIGRPWAGVKGESVRSSQLTAAQLRILSIRAVV